MIQNIQSKKVFGKYTTFSLLNLEWSSWYDGSCSVSLQGLVLSPFSTSSNCYVKNAFVTDVQSCLQISCSNYIKLLVEDSCFCRCISSTNPGGGAIYFSCTSSTTGGQSVIYKVCALQCETTYSSPVGGQFAKIYTRDSSGKNIAILLSLIECAPRFVQNYRSSSIIQSYSDLYFNNCNSSLNKCHRYSSGAFCLGNINRVGLSTFFNNSDYEYSSILHQGYSHLLISCNIISNYQYLNIKGTIETQNSAILTINDCVFHGNDGVGTHYLFATESGSITVGYCYFSTPPTGSGSVVITNNLLFYGSFMILHSNTQACHGDNQTYSPSSITSGITLVFVLHFLLLIPSSNHYL